MFFTISSLIGPWEIAAAPQFGKNSLFPALRIAWWQMALMAFDFTAEHRPGASHSLPDYMSRPPELDEEESIQPEEPQPLTNSPLPPDFVCTPPASLPESDPVLTIFPAQSEDDIVKNIVELTRTDPDFGPIWNYLVNKEQFQSR